jgi:hypothetical protein
MEALAPCEQYQALKSAVAVHLITDLAAMVADYARDGLTWVIQSHWDEGEVSRGFYGPVYRSAWSVAIDIDHIFIGVTGSIEERPLPPQRETARHWKKIVQYGCDESYDSDLFRISICKDETIRIGMKKYPAPNPSCAKIKLPSHLKAAFLQHLRDLCS